MSYKVVYVNKCYVDSFDMVCSLLMQMVDLLGSKHWLQRKNRSWLPQQEQHSPWRKSRPCWGNFTILSVHLQLMQHRR